MVDKKKQPSPRPILAVRIAPELKRRLKGWAGLNGVQVQEVVVAALEEYLKKRSA
jgi:hypothetical protein